MFFVEKKSLIQEKHFLVNPVVFLGGGVREKSYKILTQDFLVEHEISDSVHTC